MRTSIQVLFITALLAYFPAAFSHGLTEPQHGGIVKVVGDVSLELVNGKDSVRVYLLSDEGITTQGMSGKIKVKNAHGDMEHTLVPTGEAGFIAEGFSIPSGSEVLAIITLADGYSKVAGKFAVK